uniref:CCDC66 domain-containing protein n=1 Tax=Gongylonema pulchrum TaxID=637853 RepID=A0A183DQF3_9BILA
LPSLAPSPGFFPSERSDPTQPLRHDAVTVTTNAEGGAKPSTVFDSRFTVDGGVQLLRQTKIDDDLIKVQSFEPGSPKPSRQLVVEERNNALSRPTTVHISESGAVVTTNSALSNEKTVEVSAGADLVRPAVEHEADFVCTLKVSDKQQLRLKIIGREDNMERAEAMTRPVAGRFSSSEQPNDHAQQQLAAKMPKKIKDSAAYKSFDSLLQAGSGEFAGTAQTSQSLLNIAGKGAVSEARSRHVIPIGDSIIGNAAATAAAAVAVGVRHPAADKRPLGVSLSTEFMHEQGTGKKLPHAVSNIIGREDNMERVEPMTRAVAGRFSSSEQPNDLAQQQLAAKMPKKIKDAAAYKSFDSLLQAGSGEFAGTAQTSQSLLNIAGKGTVSEARSRHVIPIGDSIIGNAAVAVGVRHPAADKRPLGVSLSTEFMHEQGTGKKLPHAVSNTAFKVMYPTGMIRNAEINSHAQRIATDATTGGGARGRDDHRGGAKKTVVEVRRPSSYPETTAVQSSGGPTIVKPSLRNEEVSSEVQAPGTNAISARPLPSPPLSPKSFSRYSAVVAAQAIENSRRQEPAWSRAGALERNRRQFAPEQEQRSDQGNVMWARKGLEQRKEKAGNQNGVVPEQEYNYFGTASSSSSDSSKKVQRRSYESSFSSHGSPSFIAAVTGGSSSAAVSQAVAAAPATSRIATNTAPPPEPPVDYYESNVSGSTDDRPQAMTSTSHQVFGVKQDYELRKQQLHELRRLQREEARQLRELNAKAEASRSDQAKRFAAEKEVFFFPSVPQLRLLKLA